jgi:hypothetical protein
MKGEIKMSGMKPWERDIIEYRPDIGLETHVLSLVQKQAKLDAEETSAPVKQFQMTPVIKATISMLGVDMLEDMIASLSRATALLNQLDMSLSHDATYIAYKKAIKDGDIIDANQLYLSSLDNINGNPDFDVYPMLSDLPDEMETYLDYLNQELFDGDADYSDLSIVRKQEEHQVEQLVIIESEDLRVTKSIQLTDEQRTLIQQMIDGGTIDAVSVDAYVDGLARDQLSQGSSRINYEEMTNRVQFIATAKEKAGMYKQIVNNMENYIKSKLSAYVGGDIKGSLGYVVDLQDSLPQAKESFEQLFAFHATQSKQAYINQVRVANRDVREFLDKKLSSVKIEKGSITDRVKRLMRDESHEDRGAQMMMESLTDSLSASVSTWKFILVEHIGTSEMNTNQSKRFFDTLSNKRRNQTFYKYTDLIGREYTGSTSETDMDQFISNYKIDKLS